MDPAVLAQRNAKSLNRMVAAAEVLADRFGLPITLGEVRSRDPQLAALFQREAITELLEALVTATEKPMPVEIKTATDDRTVAELVPLIAEMDYAHLIALSMAEESGRCRKGVTEAISARLAVLEAETPQLILNPREVLAAFREGLNDAEQEGAA